MPSSPSCVPAADTHRAIALLVIVLGILAPPPVAAAIYTVGTGAPCTHTSVQAALNTARLNSNGPHEIRLLTGTHAVPNGLTLHDPMAHMTISGGWSSCTATSPTSGARSVLDASGGNDGTAFDIRYGLGDITSKREIRLQRLDITGGSSETHFGANPEGGGLELRGNLRVFVEQGTRVLGNHTGRGGGIYMQGGPSWVELELRNAEIRNNVASLDGGGIFCREGLINVRDARINFNEAGRDGGGVTVLNSCVLTATASPGATVEFNGNRAGTIRREPGEGRGGAIFYRKSGANVGGDGAWDMDLGGATLAVGGTLLFIGNSAEGNGTYSTVGSGGGAIYLEGTGSQRQRVRVRDAVFAANSVRSPGGAQGGAAIRVSRAVELLVEGTPRRCDGTFGFGLCSAFFDHNRSAIGLDALQTSDPDTTPRVTVRRTRFTGQTSGLGVIDDTMPRVGQRVRVENSIIDGNASGNAFHFSGTDAAILYTTVIGNSFSTGNLLRTAVPSGQTYGIQLHGSILWQPGMSMIRYEGLGSVQISHGGCLLAHTTAGLPQGALIQTGAPALEADWTPSITSAALDVCDNPAGVGGSDAYGQARIVDQPWLSNVLGPIDLGAVERPFTHRALAIFGNGFD
jgi:hypothetical protein